MDLLLMSTEGKQVSFSLFEEIQFITVLSDMQSLCFLLKSILSFMGGAQQSSCYRIKAPFLEK